jgi:hypothetical protein
VTPSPLQLQEPDEKEVFTYKRLSRDYQIPISTRVPIEDDVFGAWRFHYHTHDYGVVPGRDHSYGVFAMLPDLHQPDKGDVPPQLWTGTWQMSNGKLLTDTKSVPAFEGDRIRTHQGEWPIVGIEPRRIAVREGPVRCVWQRLN